MKKFFVSLLSIMLLVSFGIIAQARPKGDKGGPPPKGGRCPGMEIMDTDKDGKISLQEWQDFHAKHFKKMDKNGDGFLTKDEMGPMGPMEGPKGPKPE
jgi:hypothetical protein